MTNSIGRIAGGWLVVFCGVGFVSGVAAQTLYDGSRNTLPTAQGWSYAALPGTATQVLTNGAARLSTMASLTEQAGYSRVTSMPLDRATGVTLHFTFQLPVESHTNSNRAGFSVILLAQDKRGIELGFWTNSVFAQADNPLFVRAEEATRNFTAGFVHCALNLYGANYSLTADGAPLLTGPVRDYTAFTGLFDPYETSNFVFLGDDTRSAQAVISLKSVVLVTSPTVTWQGSNLLGWLGVSNQIYTVNVTTNLLTWQPAGSVVSGNNTFRWTNHSPAPRQFFRVTHP